MVLKVPKNDEYVSLISGLRSPTIRSGKFEPTGEYFYTRLWGGTVKEEITHTDVVKDIDHVTEVVSGVHFSRSNQWEKNPIVKPKNINQIRLYSKSIPVVHKNHYYTKT